MKRKPHACEWGQNVSLSGFERMSPEKMKQTDLSPEKAVANKDESATGRLGAP